MTTLKTLAKARPDIELKKDDFFKVRYSDLIIAPGHNLRDFENPKVQAHIDSILKSILAGDDIPPLDVRVNSDNQIEIVDGECRYRAYGLAIQQGAPIEYIKVMSDTSNDVGRVKKMMKRNQGLSFTPLETGFGYQRFINFGLEIKEIAETFNCSTESVKQLLLLANANSDVHFFVKKDLISAHRAIELVRIHGEKAGAVIKAQVEAAKASGKERVTKATTEGRALPKKIVRGLVETVAEFTTALDRKTRETLAELETQPPEVIAGKTVSIDAKVLLDLLKAQQAIEAVHEKQKRKREEKENAARQADIQMN